MLTDDDLRRHVLSRLSQFGPQVTRAVAVVVRGGDVTLISDVSSDYERRMIEHTLTRLAGIGRLENRLRIGSDDSDAAERDVVAKAPAFSAGRAGLAVGVVGAMALGWGLWQLAAACTG